MMSDAADPLAAEYGDALPPGLAALTGEQRQLLADAIEAARVRQAEALAEATENGLRFVPKVMRGTIKKVVFG